MVKVKYDNDFELLAYSPKDEFLGVIRTENNLMDFQLQIAVQKLEGYYVINVENGKSSDVSSNGRIYEPAFPERADALLEELLEF